MREILELPKLSLTERDRRWTEVRNLMKENDLDCLLLFGFPLVWDFATANARYLSMIGGNAEFNILIFPLDREPSCFVMMPTFVEYWKRAQNWVKDVRAKKGQLADNIVSRLKALGLKGKKIGVDGLPGPLDPDGWVPYGVYDRIHKLMPETFFVSTDNLMEVMRAVKSPEEILFLEKAAELGDLMLESCFEIARPGIKECEVYGKMMEVMLGNGGEEPTLFLWAADAHPFPHPFRLPTTRFLEEGDIIICEMHPKYGGYFTHVERTFSIGEPRKEYTDIYDGCLKTYLHGMELFRPGKRISEAMKEIKKMIESLGLDICEAGIHGHGLSSLEYPRCRLHAMDADTEALDHIGDQFKPGMVFAFNIDLVNPKYMDGDTGCVFAETIIVTNENPRRLHSFPINFQVIGV